jgi:hypothetical protein
MPRRGEMHAIHYFFIFLLAFSSSNGMSNAVDDDALEKPQLDRKLSLGAVVDYTSLAGKRRK